MHPGAVITGSLGYNTRIVSSVGAEMLVDNLKVAIARFCTDSRRLVSLALSELGPRRGPFQF